MNDQNFDLFAVQESVNLLPLERVLAAVQSLPLDDQVACINTMRQMIHKASPFASEPVDCVLWESAELVQANDYNPNSVAPPEMKLLELSILEDGYTQPIVGWRNDSAIEVVDGFHRNRVGKESKDVRKRVHGYLPVVVANSERLDKGDRMASTIRHNRARGKHRVEAMSDIVIELKRRNWSDDRISKELGMEPDEVLRLCQLSGIADLFKDEEFSKSWDIEDFEEDFAPLQDDEASEVKDSAERILHTYDKWECYPAGMYETKHPELTDDECRAEYARFLRNIPEFEAAMEGVIGNWPRSCEHYLTNEKMNRIAWMGQSAICFARKVPSVFCGGFNQLSEVEQSAANEAALKHLNLWRSARGLEPLTMDQAESKTKANLY